MSYRLYFKEKENEESTCCEMYNDSSIWKYLYYVIVKLFDKIIMTIEGK